MNDEQNTETSVLGGKKGYRPFSLTDGIALAILAIMLTYVIFFKE